MDSKDTQNRAGKATAKNRDEKSPARKRSTKGGKKDTPKQHGSVSATKSRGKSGKQSLKKIREKRRLQQKQEEEEEERKKARKSGNPALENHPGNIIAADPMQGEAAENPEDFFWEVESVVGKRMHKGRVEYLIRWKNCSEDDNTWEPVANLCDTALEEAKRYVKMQKQKEKEREENEKMLFGDMDAEVIDVSNDDTNMNSEETPLPDERHDEEKQGGVVPMDVEGKTEDEGEDQLGVVDDDIWEWSDKDQVKFRHVERINVNDPTASARVKDARINGTPIVLVGHVGWANFAKRWVKKKGAVAESVATVSAENSVQGEKQDNAASITVTQNEGNDASQGGTANESGTVQGESMDEEKKATENAKKQESDETQDKAADTKEDDRDWLDLAGEVYELDMKSMIQDIGDENVPVIKRSYNEEKPIQKEISASKFLTTCWPSGDSNDANQSLKSTQSLYLHQWQFPLSDSAGRKLCHNNNPLPKDIMGEDLLKYWIDLPQCKHDSPLQYIFMGREDTLSKLHKDNGGLEISIAPIVGHKECVLVHRNDGSNCLYHLEASLDDIDLHKFPLLAQARIWRTTVKPGEILLMPYGTYHQCRNLTPCLSYSRFHLDTVNLVPFLTSFLNKDAPEIDHEEVLWNLATELMKKVDNVFDKTQSRIKEGLDAADLLTDDVVETVNILRVLRNIVREIARREEIQKLVKGSDGDNRKNGKGDSSEEQNFSTLCDDVDMSLHEFRYRNSEKVPEFKPRRGKVLKNTLSAPSGKRSNVIKRDIRKFDVNGKPAVAFNSSLDNNYMSLVNSDIDKNYPNAERKKVGEALIGKLNPDDQIVVKIGEKHVKGIVEEIIPQMKAAYLSFKSFPLIYDEYQPYDRVRLPNEDEIAEKDMKKGLSVIDVSTDNKYEAEILSVYSGPMARVKYVVSQHSMTRLIPPSFILGRYIPKGRATNFKTKKSNGADHVNGEPKRPTAVGQVVYVEQRGLAKVTKVYPGGKLVDISFNLDNDTTDAMIAVDHVRLAPEMDPEKSGGDNLSTKQRGSPEGGKIATDGSVVSPTTMSPRNE